MDLMDSTCGWGTPAPLLCQRLLAPKTPPACPPAALLAAPAGVITSTPLAALEPPPADPGAADLAGLITTAVAAVAAAGGGGDGGGGGGAGYAPLSACQWTVEAPDAPYIDLSFAAFNTEPLYDALTVEVRPLGDLGSGAALRQRCPSPSPPAPQPS